MLNKFVFSDKEFETIKEAENKANGRFQSGEFKHKTRLYKISEVYYPKIKFIKAKIK